MSNTIAGNAQLDTSQSPTQLRVSGDWTLAHYATLKHLSETLKGQYDERTHIDLNSLGALDTAAGGPDAATRAARSKARRTRFRPSR